MRIQYYEDCAEGLFAHCDALGLALLDRSRMDEVTLSVVRLAARNYLAALLGRRLDQRCVIVERVMHNDKTHYVLELLHGTERGRIDRRS